MNGNTSNFTRNLLEEVSEKLLLAQDSEIHLKKNRNIEYYLSSESEDSNTPIQNSKIHNPGAEKRTHNCCVSILGDEIQKYDQQLKDYEELMDANLKHSDTNDESIDKNSKPSKNTKNTTNTDNTEFSTQGFKCMKKADEIESGKPNLFTKLDSFHSRKKLSMQNKADAKEEMGKNRKLKSQVNDHSAIHLIKQSKNVTININMDHNYNHQPYFSNHHNINHLHCMYSLFILFFFIFDCFFSS
jgi:hypothetical protein